jgi:glucose-1-phosphate cytidylyltransferase
MEFESSGIVNSFKEKPSGDGHWINGGFFILKKEIFGLLTENSDNEMWEEQPMETLTQNEQLVSFKHNGFWRCMDALRDKVILDELWNANKAKWKNW